MVVANWKILIPVVAMSLLAISFTGCLGSSEHSVTQFNPVPKYDISYKPTVESFSASLQVKVKAKPDSLEDCQSLQLSLFDSSGKRVGLSPFISKDDLQDGFETVNISMGELPKGGTYTLKIMRYTFRYKGKKLTKDQMLELRKELELKKKTLNDILKDTSYSKEEVYSKKISFKGSKIKVSSAMFEIEKIADDLWCLCNISVTVTNEGDLGAYIEKMGMEINGEQEFAIIYKGVPPGKSENLTWGVLWFEKLKEGKHPLIIRLYAGNNVLAEYTTTINVPENQESGPAGI